MCKDSGRPISNWTVLKSSIDTYSILVVYHEDQEIGEYTVQHQ